LRDQVEQAAQFRQVALLDLADVEHVDLEGHVHHLEQVLGIVALLEEEGVEAVMKVVVEILAGVDLVADVAGDEMAITHEHIEAEGLQVEAGLEVEVFAEREASEVITLYNIVQLWILFFQAHHATTCKDNLQLWISVIAKSQFFAPIWLFEYLVYKQNFSTTTYKFASKFCYTFTLKIEIIHIYVKAPTITCAKFLFCIL